MKYAFVEKNRRQYGVPALCEALQVSRSGYYAARHRGPSNRQKRQLDLTVRIQAIHRASREAYGAPRVHVELLPHSSINYEAPLAFEAMKSPDKVSSVRG